MHQVSACGLRAVRVPTDAALGNGSELQCVVADDGYFIDWVKMAQHGLVESTGCDNSFDQASIDL